MKAQIRKKRAALFIVWILTILLVLAVYPFRLIRRDYPAGENPGQVQSAGSSVQISPGTAVGEYILAGENHIDTIEVMIDSVTGGEYGDFLLYSVSDKGALLTASERVRLPEKSGVISIPTDVDTVPGNQYILLCTTGLESLNYGLDDGSNYGTYTIALQVPDAVNSEYLQYSFVHAADPAADVDIFTFGDADYGIDGYFLSVGVTYRLPIGVKTSAAVIAAALLIAFALSAVLCRYYGKHPEKNRLLTVRRVLQFVLTPAVTAFGIFLLVLIVPLKSFDYRWTDNLLYTTGVVLMLLAFYYWLFHVPSGGSKESARPQAGKDTDDNVFDWAQAVLIAVVIAYACDYMNGLYNIFHYVSEREMFFFFCLVFLTMFSVRELKNRAAAISLGAGTVLAVLYYNLNKAAPDAADAALLNRGLAFEAASGAVLAVVFTALIRSFVYGKKEKAVSAAEKEGRTGSSHGPAAGGCGEKGGMAADWKTPGILPDPVILLPTAAFFAWIVIFRNTRMWPVTLVFLFGLFYVLYFRWPRRDRFLHNFSNGIIINFIGTVIFCQLRRYFLGFLYIRFSMQFHTSTVTAEYMTIVTAAAAVRLIVRCYRDAGKPIRRKIESGFGDMILFGLAVSYLVFTMARTGLAAVFVLLAAVLIAVSLAAAKRGAGHSGTKEKRTGYPALSGFINAVFAMIIAAVLALPAVFTAQRIFPTMVGEPYTFAEIEEYPDEVCRNRHWDSMYYVCIERFVQVFNSRIFGIGNEDYDYWKAYREYYHLAQSEDPSFSGEDSSYLPEGEGTGLLSMKVYAAGDGQASSAETAESTADSGSAADSGQEESDYSNGRVTIWKSYILQLNMTGHDVMGVTLPDGETAVHAHNTFIQAAYDFGIPAAVLLLLCLFLTFIKAGMYYCKGNSDDPDRLCPFAVTAGFTAVGCVEWIFEVCSPLTIILFFAIAPMMVKYPKKQREDGFDFDRQR